MKIALPMIALMAFAAPVHAQSLGEKTGVNALVGVSPSDADFVKEAALGDMFETMTSELAAIRGNQQARDFAVKMNEDHQKASSELSITIKPHIDKTPLPSKLDGSLQSKLDALKKLEGEDFSKTYFKDQLSAHESAVSLFERYAKGGKDAGLQVFAQQTLPRLKMHLDMVRAVVK